MKKDRLTETGYEEMLAVVEKLREEGNTEKVRALVGAMVEKWPDRVLGGGSGKPTGDPKPSVGGVTIHEFQKIVVDKLLSGDSPIDRSGIENIVYEV